MVTSLLDVLEPLLEEADDVLVVERVVDQAAVPARAHQPHVPEETQLVGHRRFGEVEASGEILDAQLGPRQRVQHAHARQIAKRAKGFSQREGGGVAQRLTPHRGDL